MMEEICEHEAKALLPIAKTPSLIVILPSTPIQLVKASSAIYLTGYFFLVFGSPTVAGIIKLWAT
jgi:hypothetical protein